MDLVLLQVGKNGLLAVDSNIQRVFYEAVLKTKTKKNFLIFEPTLSAASGAENCCEGDDFMVS